MVMSKMSAWLQEAFFSDAGMEREDENVNLFTSLSLHCDANIDNRILSNVIAFLHTDAYSWLWKVDSFTVEDML